MVLLFARLPGLRHLRVHRSAFVMVGDWELNQNRSKVISLHLLSAYIMCVDIDRVVDAQSG